MARAGAKGHQLGAALRRILCISAHPDDNEFTIGGTIARWTREGRHVTFCLVTAGGAGVNEHTPSPEGLIPVRERETHAAARILGVKDVIFLGYADGTLQPTLAMRRDLTRVVRRVKPDVVMCGDPTVRFYGNEYMNHPDHRAVADAALDAVFPSSETSAIFPELLAEGLPPHKVRQVFLAGALEPDVFVDIAGTLATKCRALQAHRSQVGKGEWVEQLLKGWAARDGKRAGNGLRYAEAFKRMVLG
jgi:LmbE family N-acetylglucosaminyl deacetylase